MRGAGFDERERRLLVLTCVTGMIDAVAFLGLGQLFCAMQTGNVVFLGLGVAGAEGATVEAPLTAVCAFLAGGAAAALLLRADRSGWAGKAVTVEIALLLVATALAAALDPQAGETAALATIATLAAAMGLRTTVVRVRGGANLATTVLNLTAVGGGAAAGAGGPAAGSGAAGATRLASRADLLQRAVALVVLLAGAVAGALLLEVALWLPLALATALTAATHALERPAPAPAT